MRIELPLIRLRGVTKVYGEGALAFQALKGVDLRHCARRLRGHHGPQRFGQIHRHEHPGLPGPAHHRRIPVQGRACRGPLARRARAMLRRRYFGFVFQGFNLLARTSAQENVELPCCTGANLPAARKAAAARALDAVGLKGWEHHTPAELSGGQQQRVAIARAIVTEPVVLLADEPTGNLDTQRSHEIMELLWRLNAEQGITVLMVTHEPDMAAYARRMVRLCRWQGRFSDAPQPSPGRAAWQAHPGGGCCTATPVPESRDAVQHHFAGVALHPAQPDALVSHHSGHRDRRQCGDHHGDAGQRRHHGCADANIQPGHQPVASAPWPAHGAGRWHGCPVIQGHRCRRDRRSRLAAFWPWHQKRVGRRHRGGQAGATGRPA
jgi:putative ABC transport system ATP-binding protein